VVGGAMKGINGNYLLTEPKSFHLLKNIFEWSPTELVFNPLKFHWCSLAIQQTLAILFVL
jgi:hypothetical protein